MPIVLSPPIGIIPARQKVDTNGKKFQLAPTRKADLERKSNHSELLRLLVLKLTKDIVKGGKKSSSLPKWAEPLQTAVSIAKDMRQKEQAALAFEKLSKGEEAMGNSEKAAFYSARKADAEAVNRGNQVLLSQLSNQRLGFKISQVMKTVDQELKKKEEQ